MCASCGCLRPDDDHGDGANITLNELERAATAAGITVAEVVDNIRDTCEVAGRMDPVVSP